MLEELSPSGPLAHQVEVPPVLYDLIELCNAGMSRFPQDLKLLTKPLPIGLVGEVGLVDEFKGGLFTSEKVSADFDFVEGAFADGRS